jgi:hypothetical protein
MSESAYAGERTASRCKRGRGREARGWQICGLEGVATARRGAVQRTLQAFSNEASCAASMFKGGEWSRGCALPCVATCCAHGSWLASRHACAIPIAKCKLENVWSYIYQITRSLGRENYWGGNTLLISSREWRVGVKKAMTIVPCPFQSSFPLRPRLFFLPPCDRGTNLQSVVLGEVPAPWRLWCRRCGC